MKPGLRAGQVVLFSHSRNFNKGDIVLAFMDGREVVKRVAEYKDGQVFLLGDNDTSSTDSRKHGWLIDRHIHGKLIWPWVKKLK